MRPSGFRTFPAAEPSATRRPRGHERPGTFVAVRAGTHQSVISARPEDLHPVPGGVQPVDAALWQTALVAEHGLELGGYTPGEPVTVVGAGLIGTMTWRTAAALGSGECRVLASSRAKQRTVQACPAGTAVEFLLAEQAGASRNRHRLVVDATGTRRPRGGRGGCGGRRRHRPARVTALARWRGTGRRTP